MSAPLDPHPRTPQPPPRPGLRSLQSLGSQPAGAPFKVPAFEQGQSLCGGTGSAGRIAFCPLSSACHSDRDQHRPGEPGHCHPSRAQGSPQAPTPETEATATVQEGAGHWAAGRVTRETVHHCVPYRQRLASSSVQPCEALCFLGKATEAQKGQGTVPHTIKTQSRFILLGSKVWLLPSMLQSNPIGYYKHLFFPVMQLVQHQEQAFPRANERHLNHLALPFIGPCGHAQ